MSSDTLLILIAGCTVFAITTLAALWTGYLLLQERWAAENPDLTTEDDDIRPLFNKAYPQQQSPAQPPGPAVGEAHGEP